ncbi:MAG: hypothetical protein ACTMUB_02730 [cyanobacterium endosymbiont of Rhopalodia musculus]|uniref:hypothetical protein n=1 Tax=cyanobacterium endosymbiont of Epithemia clementina EcSB TaxID=3034674 RepID=UPI00315D3333
MIVSRCRSDWLEVSHMGVWIITVGVLFVFVRLFQWFQGFMLPFPIYLLAGAFLAIASNYEKGLGALLKQIHTTSDSSQ